MIEKLKAKVFDTVRQMENLKIAYKNLDKQRQELLKQLDELEKNSEVSQEVQTAS